MEYKKIVVGTFLSRPNRFIATVEVDGKPETVHVKNTGRCKELLVKGARVFLSEAENEFRKTRYDLIAVIKKRGNLPSLLINMDSQIPNLVAEEWFKKGNVFSKDALIRREVKYKNSRFDFYIEDKDKKCFLEVKGVTLENEGVALFPDAPTIRGIKHINELIEAKKEGYETYILFVVQMTGVKLFKPNAIMHKDFADALKKAKKAGVKIIATDCLVTENSIIAQNLIETKI